MVGTATKLVRDVALEVQDYELYLAAEWELLYKSIMPERHVDFMQLLSEVELEARPQSTVFSMQTSPTISASFVFERQKGNVGVFEYGQLAITCNAHASLAALELSTITLVFEGGPKSVTLQHSPNIRAVPATDGHSDTTLYDADGKGHSDGEDLATSVANLNIKEQQDISADLTFKPGQTKIFTVKVMPREAGEVNATQVVVSIKAAKFDFGLNIPLLGHATGIFWWQQSGGKAVRGPIGTDHPTQITILPKPPKIEISTPTLRSTYYIGERIAFPVELRNKEDDVADIRISVSLSGNHPITPALWWVSDDKNDTASEHRTVQGTTSVLGDYGLGELAAAGTWSEDIAFHALDEAAEYSLLIKVDYFVKSDPDTPLTKQYKENLAVIGPFEANYEYTPHVNLEPWPSYFHLDDDTTNDDPSGIKQSWSVSAHVASFAVETLVVEQVSLHVIETRVGASTTVRSATDMDSTSTVAPKELFERAFEFDVQKISLEDRRDAAVGFRLDLVWRREEAPGERVSSSLLVPPLKVPFGEPRVLVSAAPSQTNPSIIKLTYTIENPSTHFLTFSMTMETNEDFAFSGAKMATTQLVPLSRQDIRYNLLPTKQGIWIRPTLRIIDTGFGQELRPIPTDGCKPDKKGFLVWVDVQE
jgi:hypothetical protein